MAELGTALRPGATRLLLLGAGELGKEVAIEAQRLGVEVIAADRYADAPAMQVAHRGAVIDMLDPIALRALIERERPDVVVPEIEAIATAELLELEKEASAGSRPRNSACPRRRTASRTPRRNTAPPWPGSARPAWSNPS